MCPDSLNFATWMSLNAEKTAEKKHLNTTESFSCLIWTFCMEIATGAPCKFAMKSNVEINFIQKKMKKDERRENGPIKYCRKAVN